MRSINKSVFSAEQGTIEGKPMGYNRERLEDLVAVESEGHKEEGMPKNAY
jgi:hypothetical protein